MLTIVKNFFLVLILVTSSDKIISETDPYIFIDKNAQLMVTVSIQNKNLFAGKLLFHYMKSLEL